MTETTTLTVRTGSGEQTRAEARQRIQALEDGDPAPTRHVLVLANEDDLQRLLSPANLALLRVIRRHEPSSMRAAADLVDRDFKEVHRNLTELAQLNVIEFENEGRAKRPVVRFDEIDIQVSLTDTATESVSA